MQARVLHMKQAVDGHLPGQLYADIERLRLLVLPITPDSPVMHCFPWVYFIVAALSQDLSHRACFTGRLREVYEKTQMNSITHALKRLEQIWLLGPSTIWARHPTLVTPVLII